MGSERRPEVKEPIQGANPSTPKKARVDPNVDRNVGVERRPEVKDPIPGASPSTPARKRFEGSIDSNVGVERRPEVKDPINGTSRDPEYRRVERQNTHDSGGQRVEPAKDIPRKTHNVPQKERAPDVVHTPVYTPDGWNPQYHKVDIPKEYGQFDPRRWGAGYVYYNPPKSKNVSVVKTNKGQTVSKGYRPQRDVNRKKSTVLWRKKESVTTPDMLMEETTVMVGWDCSWIQSI